MKQLTIFICFIFHQTALYSQSYPNLFNHYIESPPSQFVPIDSVPENSQRRGAFMHKGKVYDVTIKPFVNKDIEINGSQIKIRYYDASRIFQRLRVVCLYKDGGDGWKCFMGRFFTQHEETIGLGIDDSDKHVIGLIHPHLANLLVRTINFHPEGSTNRGEWKNIGGVQVTGKPEWVAAHMSDNKHVIVSKLNDRNKGNPLQEIIEAKSLIDAAEKQNETPKNKSSGFSLDLL